MHIEELKQRLINYNRTKVNRCEKIPNHKVMDFVIGDKSDYNERTIATSSIVVKQSNQTTVTEGTVHVPTHVENYAVEGNGMKEDVCDGISVNVKKYVLHIFLDEGISISSAGDVIDAVLVEKEDRFNNILSFSL